ncbi:MAG: MarC family protein [Candidatus Omnitrophica bacterium]|nr:MarC family protein [Candidatus Omnitrophota bacterium]
MRNYFLAFVPIFVAVDALGTVPLFLSLTDGMSTRHREELVRQSIVTALFVALAFLAVGRLVLQWLGITINDFLVAGGAILFIISIRDLLRYGKVSAAPIETMGVVPLAVPLIVGPAVLTTSLILLNSFGIFPTLFSLVANILLCGAILRTAPALLRFLGESGAHTLSKISSLLLAAIGVMLIRVGLIEILRNIK